MGNLYINLHNSQAVMIQKVWLTLFRIGHIEVEAAEGWFHVSGPKKAIIEAHYALVGLQVA
jgi:hypothetical protein